MSGWKEVRDRIIMSALIVACLAIPGYVEALTEPQKAVMVETPTPAPSEAVQPATEPEEAPTALYNPTPLTDSEYAALVEACDEHGIDVSLVLGLIQVESNFRADAVSKAGCYGYCQINPSWHPADLSPEENIRYGVGFLASQFERYGNLESGLDAYNKGHDTGDTSYARKVMRAAEEWEKVVRN